MVTVNVWTLKMETIVRIVGIETKERNPQTIQSINHWSCVLYFLRISHIFHLSNKRNANIKRTSIKLKTNSDIKTDIHIHVFHCSIYIFYEKKKKQHRERHVECWICILFLVFDERRLNYVLWFMSNEIIVG